MNNKQISKGEIDRLGEKIRNEKDNLNHETLRNLQQYRTSHKDSIAHVFKVLCKLTKRVHQNSIVTYRIKRFESIIGKLGRYPDMKFSRMWDIAGCRCILRNNYDVYKLKKLISEKLEIRKVYDYIEEPQKEGYKALHVFVSSPIDDKVIEIQIRNQQDHNWATLVEITDLLFDSKLKEYKENKELLRFHYLLSFNQNELEINEKVEIAKIIKDYEYFQVLSGVFSRNYLQVRNQWIDITNRHNQKYFLIEANKNEAPKIESFLKFSEAEEEYFERYKNRNNANIVLIHLPNPCYNQMSIAYSNYILTFHSFLEECFQILESLIVASLRDRNFRLFKRNFNWYNSLVFIHLKNLNTEIIEINKYDLSNPSAKNIKKRKEWSNDIQKQIRQINYRSKKLRDAFIKYYPRRDFDRFKFKTIVKLNVNKYKRKLRRVS